MSNRDLNKYTLEELQDIENYNQDALFNSIILVPMNEIHESSFRCMKGILVRDGNIVGCVSGWSDVIHPNGIGNYGKDIVDFDIANNKIPYMGLSIDCLDKSRCIRLMFGNLFQIRTSFIGSDLEFYKVDNDNK